MEVKPNFKSPAFWLTTLVALLPHIVQIFLPFMKPEVQAVALAVSGALVAQFSSQQHALTVAAAAAPTAPAPAPAPAAPKAPEAAKS